MDLNSMVASFEEGNVETKNEAQEVVVKEEVPTMEGQINFVMTPILSWFNKYKPEEKNPNGPRQIKMKVSGVDPSKTVIFTIPTEGSFEDQPARKLIHIEPADRYLVPDVNSDITFLQQNTMFDYEIDENTKLRMYVSKKTSLLCFLLAKSDFGFIPYSHSEIAVDENVTVSYHTVDQETVSKAMSEPVNKEVIQIYYRQIQKHIGNMNTVGDAVTWLLAKQAGVIDVNHHIEIEKAMLEIIKL